jgi:putative Mg2+ transporter-C (MgtC) family protein
MRIFIENNWLKKRYCEEKYMPEFLEDLFSSETLVIFLKLGLAILFSGFIGLERELHGRPAGLRTHILVSLGSCLVMIVSLIFAEPPYAELGKADPTRIASNIVTGVGFLGAGCILHAHGDIKGITTAATLWVSAMIGMAVGAGEWIPAILTTLLALFTLTLLRVVEAKITKRNAVITMICDTDKPVLKTLLSLCYEQKLKTRKIDTSIVIYEQKECLKIKLEFERSTSKKALDNFIVSLRGEVNPHNISLRNDLSAGV